MQKITIAAIMLCTLGGIQNSMSAALPKPLPDEKQSAATELPNVAAGTCETVAGGQRNIAVGNPVIVTGREVRPEQQKKHHHFSHKHSARKKSPKKYESTLSDVKEETSSALK